MNCISKERYTGCLLGGAAGDALGWPVEFDSIDEIRSLFGPLGIREMKPGKGGFYEITDDTQMTLFTAEGLLRAWNQARHTGSVPDFATALQRSYLGWLSTQGEGPHAKGPGDIGAGWLLAIEGLHVRRAPGGTCLSALRDMALSGGKAATNTSKGCGGVMRAAPAGCLAVRINKSDPAGTALLAFELGRQAAALTHGHPSGHYPAGVLATVVSSVLQGETVEAGITRSLAILQGRRGSGETVASVQAALELSQDRTVIPSPEVIETLGAGWIGTEALAIGLYCALVAGEDFARGVGLAVNHSGDSDSTGSIAGNILGALLGEQAIPAAWIEKLELAEVVRQVGEDLFTAFEGTESWFKRYPTR